MPAFSLEKTSNVFVGRSKGHETQIPSMAKNSPKPGKGSCEGSSTTTGRVANSGKSQQTNNTPTWRPNSGRYGTRRYGQLLDASHEAVTETKDPIKLLFGGVLAVNKRTKAQEEARAKNEPFNPGEFDHVPIGQFIKEVEHYQDYTALSLHPYAFRGNINRKVRGIIAATRARLRGARKEHEADGGAPEEAEKPIWVTEIGWGEGE